MLTIVIFGDVGRSQSMLKEQQIYDSLPDFFVTAVECFTQSVADQLFC